MDEEKVELQPVLLRYTSEGMNRLCAIKEKAGISDNEEFFAKAVRLFEWYLDQKKEGSKLALICDDDVYRVVFPDNF